MSSTDSSSERRRKKGKKKKKHKKSRRRKDDDYKELNYQIDRVPFKDAMYYGHSDPKTVPKYERFVGSAKREKKQRYFEKSLSPIVNMSSSSSSSSNERERLAKILKSNPKDVHSWIRFARESESQERALSIFDKALEKLPNSTSIIRARLSCLERVKGYSTARQSWSQILHSSTLGKNVDMWLCFVDFTQRASSNEVVLLSKVIEMLTNAFFATDCSTNRFAMRLVSYLRIAGHVSESVSFVRATVEFVYFRPNGIEETDSLTWFEAYWIGHDDGESWSNWYRKQLEGRCDDDNSLHMNAAKRRKAKSWSEWIEFERQRTTYDKRRVEFKTLKPFLRTTTHDNYDLIFELLRIYGVEVAWRVSSWEDVFSRDNIGREKYKYVL